MTVVNVSVPTR